jgi:hypothetical protein
MAGCCSFAMAQTPPTAPHAPQAVVSPGGVGFDINCGVRLLRTNLSEDQVAPVKEQLAQVCGHVCQGGRPSTAAHPDSTGGTQQVGGMLMYAFMRRHVTHCDVVPVTSLFNHTRSRCLTTSLWAWAARASSPPPPRTWRLRWRWAWTGASGE